MFVASMSEAMERREREGEDKVTEDSAAS